MKRGTLGHPKLLRLARRLHCEPYAALGLLEALLDWAYRYARRGDVGRFNDADLAEAVGWRGKPGELVTALVETRWLDPCPVHRLVIHDLAEHADRTWKQAIDRAHVSFVRTQCVLNEDSLKPRCALPPEPEPEPEPEEKECPVDKPAELIDRTFLLVGDQTQDSGSASEFERIWKLYPRKENKQEARKAWRQLKPDAALIGLIERAIGWQRDLSKWRDGIVPHFSTYLRQRRFDDERPPDPFASLLAEFDTGEKRR
jgi:hypothetical protein